MKINDKPCCAAEAMRKIRTIDVGGVATGIVMLDDTLQKVREMNISGRERIADELMREVKIYNFVPEPAYDGYRRAVMKEYEK